ncbi:DUF502 domain-containing protein [Ponticaulis profundi]|uniref:DUF502 domain-containing protein n=1 Tax=Ponticaulis profundi TaxID=2665222 RepID=A0ABW1SEP9_9PROT
MSEEEKSVESDASSTKKNRLSFFGWVRSRLIAGLVIATPIVVPIFVLVLIISWIDERVKPIVRSAIPPGIRNTELFFDVTVNSLIGYIPGLGVLVAVVCLVFLGAFGANWLGRQIIRISEQIATRVPIVRTLYTPIRQLVDIFSDKDSSSFKEVVLVEYPKPGTWAVGFLTTRAREEVAHHLNKNYIGVFVPTTPNPTSGFLIFVPENEVRRLNMTVEDGAKLIVSAGVVMPKNEKEEVVILDGDDV